MIIQNPILTGSGALNGLNLTATNLATTSSNSFTSDQSITGSLGISANTTIAGTLTVTGSIVGLVTSASYVLNAVSSSKAVSASYSDTASFANSFNVAGNLTASNAVLSGTLTAQTLVVQTITSSIVYSSGSNNFGNQLANTQTFTGSVNITGSMSVTGSAVFSSDVILPYSKALAFNSILNQYITADSSKLYLGAGNFARLTISSSGLIGIGTTSPADKLHVSGGNILIENGNEVRFKDTGGNPRTALYFDASNNLYLGNSTTGSVIFASTGFSETMRVTGSRVGIGTTNPQAILHIVSPVVASGTALKVVSDGNSSDKVFEFTGVDGLAAQTMVMLQGGYVGIGTTNPAYPLEISSATGTQLKMSTNDATSANNAGIFFYNESSATSSTRRSYMLLDPNGANAAGGDYAYFEMYGSGTARVMNQLTSGVLALGVGGTTIINITGSKVGINSANPNYSVTTTGTLNAGFILLGDNNNNSNNTIEFVGGPNSTTYGAGHIQYYSNSYLSICNGGGNVYIGTTSGAYKLTLNGQPGANGYTAWTNYSDSRLKENITDLEATNILDKICAIRPVTFNYNELSGFDETTRSRRISGFIAQELMEKFPDMIGTIKLDNTEYYDTNLSNLNLYLVKAIQELKAEIDELKNK